MIIRLLRPDELEKYCRVSSMAFIWSLELEKEHMPEQSVCLGAFDDDGETIFAELEFFEFTSVFCEGSFPVVGIGGVASLPEHRNKGAVRALFEYIEKLSAEKGWVCGFLYPFSFTYYRKFGYDLVLRHAELKAPISQLSGIPRSSAEIYNGTESEKLYSLYNRCAKKTNLMPLRDSDVYFPADPYKACKYTYIWKYPNGEPGAFATYSIDRAGGVMNVDEIMFLDREAMLGMLGFLRCYDGQVKDILFTKLPATSPLIEVFDECSTTSLRMTNGPAGRIYDLEAFLRTNRYPLHSGEFAVRCVDSIERNNAVFRVRYADGTAQVERLTDCPDCCAELTATAAARVFLQGDGLTKDMLESIRGVKILGDTSSLLEAFPRRETAFFNGF